MAHPKSRPTVVFSRIPAVPFLHPDWGSFDFVPGVGWSTTIDMEERPVQLALGSDGEMPSHSMLDCLGYWIRNWGTRKPQLVAFINQECRSWPPQEVRPEASRLCLSAIEILWPDQPWSSMLYLTASVEEERQFHLTFDGQVPFGFAYDH